MDPSSPALLLMKCWILSSWIRFKLQSMLLLLMMMMIMMIERSSETKLSRLQDRRIVSCLLSKRETEHQRYITHWQEETLNFSTRPRPLSSLLIFQNHGVIFFLVSDWPLEFWLKRA
jgi:hypothetical protein